MSDYQMGAHSFRVGEKKINAFANALDLSNIFISFFDLDSAALARKLEGLEKKYDARFKVVFDAIRKLMALPKKPIKKIGF